MPLSAFNAALGGLTFCGNVTANHTNFNLATYMTNYGWNGSSRANFIVNIASGVSIYASTSSYVGMTIPSSMTGYIKVYNDGVISGGGGSLVHGGSSSGGNGGNGGAGSTALSVGASNIILDNTNGIIRGGGGGGGGGGGTTCGVLQVDGESGITSCQSVSNSGGNGGTGAGVSQSQTSGTNPGRTYFPGGWTDSGTGGNGANFGSNGTAGQAAVQTGASCSISLGSGGSGGSGGKSINGYSNVTLVGTGTITGSTAG